MELGHGYTIEEQATGLAQNGGIQLDVYPVLSACVCVSMIDSGKDVDIARTPDELDLQLGDMTRMTTYVVGFRHCLDMEI
jgi:hypothetical protein